MCENDEYINVGYNYIVKNYRLKSLFEDFGADSDDSRWILCLSQRVWVKIGDTRDKAEVEFLRRVYRRNEDNQYQ